MDNLVILGAVAPDPLDRGSFFDPGCYRVRLQLNRRPTPTETRLVKTMLGSGVHVDDVRLVLESTTIERVAQDAHRGSWLIRVLTLTAARQDADAARESQLRAFEVAEQRTTLAEIAASIRFE